MSPLERLVTDGGGQRVTADTLDEFLGRAGPAVLLFTGDPALRPEAQDVAVVAGQLKRQVAALAVGVVEVTAEEAVRPRFQVQVVPTVVFLKDGRPVSTVARVQEWAVYARTASLVFGRQKEVPP